MHVRRRRTFDLANDEWAHHLVVFVLENVAMPDESPLSNERHLEARDLTRIDNHRILSAPFPGLGPARGAGLVLALYDLELHQVDVDRVRILSQVVDRPYLGRAGWRILGDFVHPRERLTLAVAGDQAEHRVRGAKRLGVRVV